MGGTEDLEANPSAPLEGHRWKETREETSPLTSFSPRGQSALLGSGQLDRARQLTAPRTEPTAREGGRWSELSARVEIVSEVSLQKYRKVTRQEKCKQVKISE
jgi:hypothetical protein